MEQRGEESCGEFVVIEQSRRELRDRVCKERLCGLLTVLLLERRKARNVLKSLSSSCNAPEERCRQSI